MSTGGAPSWFLTLDTEDRNNIQHSLSQAALINQAALDKTTKDLILKHGCTQDQVGVLLQYFNCPMGLPNVLGADGFGEGAGTPQALAVANTLVNAATLAQTACRDSKPTVQDKKQRSQSHGAQYMRFLRGGRNAKKSYLGTASLVKFTGSEIDRLQLFSTWCCCDEDWGSTEVAEVRFKERSNSSELIYGWRTHDQVCSMFNNNSALALQMEAELKKNPTKHRRHPDFPMIGEMHQYYVRLDDRTVQKDKSGERNTLSLSGAVSKEQAKKMVGDDGVFARVQQALMNHPLSASLKPALCTKQQAAGSRQQQQQQQQQPQQRQRHRQ